MSRHDHVSPEGLRVDGRRATELRTMVCDMGVAGAEGMADGHSFVQLGQTKVVAYVYGPREAKRQRGPSGSETLGVLLCEVNVAPFSSLDYRKPRKNDRYAVEMGLRIRKTFEACVMLERHQRAEILLSIHIITSDGGVLSAAINAATLALLDSGVCMRDLLVSVCVGYANKTPLADVSQAEARSGLPVLNLAIHANRSKSVALCELESKISSEIFDEMFECGLQSCVDILHTLRATIIDSSVQIYAKAKSLRPLAGDGIEKEAEAMY